LKRNHTNMQIFNEELFNHKKYTVFILTYLGLDYFTQWALPLIEKQTDIQFVMVDNGLQQIETIPSLPIYQTSQNIGCAGGWNLICQLAFNRLNLNKIIIGQDDAIMTVDMIKSVWDSTNNDTIAGAYDRSFEFAIFGITKNYWNEVGLFDENFIYGGCEDNDYKHRSTLANKKVISLNYSANLNQSLSSKLLGDQLSSSNQYNAEYIKRKWGEHYEFVTPFNNSTLTPGSLELGDALRFIYDNPLIFPSVMEYTSV
jgi:hypothetical protein